MTLLLFLSILLCLYDHVDINGIVNCVECVSCVERVDHVECVSCVNCVNCVFHRYRTSSLFLRVYAYVYVCILWIVGIIHIFSPICFMWIVYHVCLCVYCTLSMNIVRCSNSVQYEYTQTIRCHETRWYQWLYRNGASHDVLHVLHEYMVS